MKFALNYSPQAVRLQEQGRISVDLFKCPAWPELVEEAGGRHAIYFHFPLSVGSGAGLVWDGHQGREVDPKEIAWYLAHSETFYVNLHPHPHARYFPGLEVGDRSAAAGERVAEALIRDVECALTLFGRERVIFENNGLPGASMAAAGFLPDVIRRVVESTGCGFLFDLSHARQVARAWDWPLETYVAGLPLQQMRELHLTGIQWFDETWMRHVRAQGVAEEKIAGLAGAWLDHLPLTEADWPVMGWAAGQIHSGAWPQPDIIAVECGGAGEHSFWQATTDAGILAAQIPRLQRLFERA